MKNTLIIALICLVTQATFAQNNSPQKTKKWGVELNVLWPIFPGNIYVGRVTYEAWRKNNLAGEAYVGLHYRPFEFREEEGDFSNLAFTFGYRQYLWKGFHLDFYQAIGPGYNRKNTSDGQDYDSIDYEIGATVGYRWEFLKNNNKRRFSPYLTMQHGFYYVAYKSNPHPIMNSTGERPIYVGIINLGVRF